VEIKSSTGWVMKYKFIVILCFTFLLNTSKAQVIKDYGLSLGIGNALTPFGYFGAGGYLSFTKTTELNLGFGIIPSGRIYGGIRQRIPTKKRVEPFASLLYGYNLSYTIVFNENTINERFYKYSSASFLKPNIGVAYKFTDHGESNKQYFWLCIGYNFRISNYYIVPDDSSGNIDQSEIEKIKKWIFRNAVYYSLGITFSLSKSKTSH
jgi:hypothetical protein